VLWKIDRFRKEYRNWTKLNMKEVVYFCKLHKIDFCYEPFSLQIEELILMFYYYGIKQFTINDIQEFYDKMQIPKLKSEGVLKLIPSKIRNGKGQMHR